MMVLECEARTIVLDGVHCYGNGAIGPPEITFVLDVASLIDSVGSSEPRVVDAALRELLLDNGGIMSKCVRIRIESID